MNDPEGMTTKNHWQIKSSFHASWLVVIQHRKFTLGGVRSLTARKHLAVMPVAPEQFKIIAEEMAR